MNIHRLLPLILLASLIYLLAIPVDIMDVDAAQYASMGREMIDRGDYLHVFDRGHEYLDKPSFIFWITAASYQIFRVSNFAFKFCYKKSAINLTTSILLPKNRHVNWNVSTKAGPNLDFPKQ